MNEMRRAGVALLTGVAAAFLAAPAAAGGSSSHAVQVGRTGQAHCYKLKDSGGTDWVVDSGCATNTPANQDGKSRKGAVWPNPRFTKHGNGTVTDNLTGLIWLEDANCFGQLNWANAVSAANGLANGACGLTDGSKAGSWRLPSRFELESLLDLEYANPALSNAAGTGQWKPGSGDPFTNLALYYYWSSTSFVDNPGFAWFVSLGDGIAFASLRTSTIFVWPVRDAQ